MLKVMLNLNKNIFDNEIIVECNMDNNNGSGCSH